uniref:Peptidase M60 domain-containing protein n=1 Tax=Amphiprion ocellaris TaxID=80972 RepID=A0A3Q1CGD3_AMPOC
MIHALYHENEWECLCVSSIARLKISIYLYLYLYIYALFFVFVFLLFHPGWMHAGYPIMTHRSTAAELVSTDHARSKGLWGPIHELGHNQQRACWEFPPNTTECTCNLWSVYVHEQVLGINRAQVEKARAEDYAKGGRKLSSWDTFVALETYMQLQDKFGWDAFKRVFAAYHKINNFPNDNHGKMNLYAETFSQAVGMNLTGFFKAWGWPIQAATEEKLSKLLPWSDHPMVQFG